MIKINVILNNIAWRKYIKNPENYIEKKLNKLNKKNIKYKKKNIYISLLLSGSKEIKRLNKKFRKKNKITDILSFPFYSRKELKKNLKNSNEIYLGDIIINLQKVKNHNNFKVEFDKLWVHGLVHLFGYDHKKDKDFYKMYSEEKRLISYL